MKKELEWYAVKTWKGVFPWRTVQLLRPIPFGGIDLLSLEGTEILLECTGPTVIVADITRGSADIYTFKSPAETISWHRRDVTEFVGQELSASYRPFFPAIMLTPHGGMLETSRLFAALLPPNKYEIGREFYP